MPDTKGITNFAVNIRPLMKKLQETNLRPLTPVVITFDEVNQIVQFYLETLDLLGKIQTEHDIAECL
jgi:hypothetical protein